MIVTNTTVLPSIADATLVLHAALTSINIDSFYRRGEEQVIVAQKLGCPSNRVMAEAGCRTLRRSRPCYGLRLKTLFRSHVIIIRVF